MFSEQFLEGILQVCLVIGGLLGVFIIVAVAMLIFAGLDEQGGDL